MQVDINISQNLSNDEKEIFEIIRNVIKQYTPKTNAYAVGGWVRDHLIGVKSNDIDIMIDNMSGEDFAKLVTKFMGIKDAHTIKSNPDKSKFLATSKAYIPLSSGAIQEVDFAQARSEVYKGDSRIPEVKPATPQEDAYRRDLTINSIFYDIKTGRVEDFTGMGIKDLITNTIRTPENPLKTFSDDPLRIFRVLRFSAKYNGNVDPETYKALQDPSLRNEIKTKVSKERIGEEIKKMLTNPHPEKAIALLKETGLLQDIVTESLKGTKYEGRMAELDMPQKNPWHKLTVWGHTMETLKHILEIYPDTTPEQRLVIILATLTHDIGKLFLDIQKEKVNHPGQISYHGHEKESQEIVGHMMRYLKMEGDITKTVSGLVGSHMRPHKFTEEESGNVRAMRRFIRQCGEQHLNWLDVFNIAVADAYSKDIIVDPETVQKYKALEEQLKNALASLKPIKSTEIQPILNGNEIMQILNIKPGPHMSKMTEFVRELRDENPDITKEEASQRLIAEFGQQNNLKQASSDDNIPSKCSTFLFDQKCDDVNKAFKEGRIQESLTILKNLKDEYGNDERIMHLTAKIVFNAMRSNRKYTDAELVNYLVDVSNKEFFDGVLCSFVAGILYMMDKAVDKETLENISRRMTKMNPLLFKKILEALPQDIRYNDTKNNFARKL